MEIQKEFRATFKVTDEQAEKVYDDEIRIVSVDIVLAAEQASLFCAGRLRDPAISECVARKIEQISV